MSEMVDRVAEALWESQGPRHLQAPWQMLMDDARAPFRVMAHAAIAAMREPTDAMRVAGEWADGNATTVVWESMIDAALASTDAAAVSSTPDAVAEDDSTLPTLDDVRGILRGYGPSSDPITRAEFLKLSETVDLLKKDHEAFEESEQDIYCGVMNRIRRLEAFQARVEAVFEGLKAGAAP